MKSEEEEEEAIESGDCKQKQTLEKCDINQNKQIVSCWQDNENSNTIYKRLIETKTDPLKVHPG